MFKQSIRPNGPFSAALRQLPAPPVPLAALSLILSRLLRSAMTRHPAVARRMGDAAQGRFLLDVTDGPVLLLMQPACGTLQAHSRRSPPDYDAVIRGTLAAFLAMLHGDADGDALFFAGDLTIEGDTGAVLALRNALDNAEIDLGEEIAVIARSAGPAARWLALRLGRATGLSLTRGALSETEFQEAIP